MRLSSRAFAVENIVNIAGKKNIYHNIAPLIQTIHFPVCVVLKNFQTNSKVATDKQKLTTDVRAARWGDKIQKMA